MKAGQFGRLTQLGYVVLDLEKAIRHWTEIMGVGPFFVLRELIVPEMWYRGNIRPMKMSVAYSHSGGVQIELVEFSEEPSIFKEAVEQSLKGVHHLGFMIDDFQSAVDFAESKGLERLQSGNFAGTSFAYYDTGDTEGVPIVELTEASAARWQRFNLIQEAAESWDGRDPIRIAEPAQLALRG